MPPYFKKTNCLSNVSEVEWEEFKHNGMLRAETVLRTYYGNLPVPFVILSLLLCTVYIFAVCRCIKTRRISRKFHTLLLNRSIGDIFLCLSYLLSTLYITKTSLIDREIVSTFDSFIVSSFWSSMFSYVSISVLKLYAIWKPFHYKQNITMKRCIYFVILSWVLFAIMLVSSFIATAFVKIHFLNEWSGCKFETCLAVFYRIRMFLTLTAYFFTIVVFLITVCILHRSHRYHQTYSVKRKSSLNSRFPTWKLGLNVSTFTIFHSFYSILHLYLITKDFCFVRRNIAVVLVYAGLTRCGMLLRIIADVVLSIIFERQIRYELLRLFGICSSDRLWPTSNDRSTLSEDRSLAKKSSSSKPKFDNAESSTTC